MSRFGKLLCVSALIVMAAESAEAQTATYRGGSIHDLDPPARQATSGDGTLEALTQSKLRHRMEEVRNVGRRIVELARPVGRLSIALDNGKIGFCTASLIDRDLILTNAHCVPSRPRRDTFRLWMGYLSAGVMAGVSAYEVASHPVERHGTLDYAILRVRGAPGTKWGTVRLSAKVPSARDGLLIVHHPGGLTKHITRGGCQASVPPVSGNDLLHTCDTLRGSSGSPIIDAFTREVIGLHNRSAGVGVNAGKLIGAVAQRSPTLRRLLAPTGITPRKQNDKAEKVRPKKKAKPSANDRLTLLKPGSAPHEIARMQAPIDTMFSAIKALNLRRYMGAYTGDTLTIDRAAGTKFGRQRLKQDWRRTFGRTRRSTVTHSVDFKKFDGSSAHFLVGYRLHFRYKNSKFWRGNGCGLLQTRRVNGAWKVAIADWGVPCR